MEDLLKNHFMEKERESLSPLAIGRVVHICSVYKASKILRKRSGGKNPITGKNKQKSFGVKYVFHSAYDLKVMMEFQMSVWYPWLARVNGDTEPFDMDRFNEMLGWLEQEDPSSVMSDLFAITAEGEEEDEDEKFEDEKPIQNSKPRLKPNLVPEILYGHHVNQLNSRQKKYVSRTYKSGVSLSRSEFERMLLWDSPGHDMWGYPTGSR
jgi:hypothetical protein